VEEEEEEEEGEAGEVERDHHHLRHFDHHLPEQDMVRHLWAVDLDMDHLLRWAVEDHLLLVLDELIWECYLQGSNCLGERKRWIRLRKR